MLQTFLLVAVPALVTLTAAFYLLHRISREEREAYGQHSYGSKPGNWNTSYNTGGNDDSVTNRRGRSTSPRSHTGECVVCFEESRVVELYPCRHKSLCEECVIKIISRNTGVCPLCRSKIQGYGDFF